MSLHNAAQMKQKDIRIGDKVVVVKRGEIIPYVERALHEARTGAEREYKFPARCPSCGAPVIQGGADEQSSDKMFYCTGGMTCPGQVRKRLTSFGRKKRCVDSYDTLTPPPPPAPRRSRARRPRP